MLLPRYSIRSVLYLAVLVAVVAVVAGQAVAGATWAVAITIGIASLLITWSVHVVFYGIVAGFARVVLPVAERRSQPAYYPPLSREADTADLMESLSDDSGEGPS